jgi:endonuclease/exonuclease/phosphatase family metal-dependent hydrolase
LSIALAGALLCGTDAEAQPLSGRALRILTFNAEHMMSPARFEQWRSFCEPLKWQEPRAAFDGGPPGRERPEVLTYCNALDGTDGRGRRLFAPVHSRLAWQEKLTRMAALVREADADVVLLQEVSDADAARAILGPQYIVASTDELWRSHSIAQNLAIGWRTNLAGASPGVELVEPVSQPGADGRRTRPGLALTLDLGGGRKLAVLNLHLKAGCRQGRFNEATSRKPERAFRRKADCLVFQRQIPALERWADDKLREGTGVLVAGDFNRDLLREIRDRMPARSDGSDPAAPVPPERIASLVAEISDEDPPAAWFALVRARRYPKLADCHRNIDSFLVSRNVEPWLATPLRQLSTTVIPFAEPVALDRVRPSDHCPHLLQLPLRASN